MNTDQTNNETLLAENQHLKHLVNELTILNDVSKAMSSTMEVKEIMAAIITKSIAIIGVEQGTIMLVEENTNQPLQTMIRGVSEKRKGRLYQLGTHLSGWMMNNLEPLLANDIATDERLKGLEIEKCGIDSLLSVPMILRGNLIGVINLFNKKDSGSFTEDDQKLMTIIGTQVASFLVNAKSFEQVQDSRDILKKQTKVLQKEVGTLYGFEGIIGDTAKINAIKEEIKFIAESQASVMILGETGTGKELVAKTIHFNSNRKDKPFVDVNSSAVPENLVESEFFGIEEGVATGVRKRIGLFEQANGGTLFIDEIGDMSMASQAKILRALEERKIRPVGSSANKSIDIRLIAATNKNLKEEIRQKNFREDLYYRLCVLEIELPSLRNRREDIPILIEHFAKKYFNQIGKIINGFSPEAIEILINYNWPGNIRELANVVERSIIISNDPVIGIEHLPQDIRGENENAIPFGDSFDEAVKNFKKRLILQSLKKSGNNKAEAARNLKISRPYMFRLLNKLELNEPAD